MSKIDKQQIEDFLQKPRAFKTGLINSNIPELRWRMFFLVGKTVKKIISSPKLYEKFVTNRKNLDI